MRVAPTTTLFSSCCPKKKGRGERKEGREKERPRIVKSKNGDRQSFPSTCCTQWHKFRTTKLRRRRRRRNTLSFVRERE